MFPLESMRFASTILIMVKRVFKFLGKVFLTLAMLGTLAMILPRLITSAYSMNRIYQKEEAPSSRLAIVFGAGLRWDGSPTAVLRDRVETAAALYFSGKVEKILMSGDNSYDYYNEPWAMKEYALSLGVPEEAIVMDYAGRRTYDTCYRARAIFGVEEALLVTQRFHLPRALFLCHALGIDSNGIEANNNNYRRRSLVIWNIREQIATLGAFIDVFVSNPLPVLGVPEPIFVD